MQRIFVPVAALALVAVITGTVVLTAVVVQGGNFEEVEAEVEATVKLEQIGLYVDVAVTARGLVPGSVFTVRAYTPGVTNCSAGLLAEIGTASSNANGELTISATIGETGLLVDDVGSVSIRSQGPSLDNPPVICFQDITANG